LFPDCILQWAALRSHAFLFGRDAVKTIVARMERQRNAGTVIPDYASAPSGLQVRPLVIFLQSTS
jgi:hypothetical protein